ncbi:hypothetical protein MPSEU_000347500 [Mayamaea pseudoterrestris]|nr:hypothetical protein MPSEU_000347500 [Mayamaea pseudoterrestris]
MNNWFSVKGQSHRSIWIFIFSMLPHRVSAFTSNLQNMERASLLKRYVNTRHHMLHSNSTIAASADETDDEKVMAQRKAAAKAKRQKLIGLAKAVDHGNGKYFNTYRPYGMDGNSFQALSGLPDRKRPFLVLGLESSCDDTGAAIVRSDGIILGEALASQSEIHEAWGGVVPGLARDAHVAMIDVVIEQALERANLTSVEEVDAIGVTVGPGLEICLRVGCDTAKALAIKYNKPFVGVHHLEAHILMARLPVNNDTDSTMAMHHMAVTDETHASMRAMGFPFLSLLVSGGHCQLMRCDSIGNYTILGGTIDDSLGEAFDKVARLLGLPIGGGGGPALEGLAREGDPAAIPLSVPLQARKDYDFSYSGLKTNVMRAVAKLVEERNVESVHELSQKDKADVAASFQNVAFKHIEQRLKRAMSVLENEGIRKLAVVGGVAANTELRRRLSKVCQEREEPWSMYVPSPRLCTDQGAMSAWAAVERLMVGSSDDPATQGVFARRRNTITSGMTTQNNETTMLGDTVVNRIPPSSVKVTKRTTFSGGKVCSPNTKRNKHSFKNAQPIDLEPLFQKMDPTDPKYAHRISQRRKMIAKGKNTAGYAEYIKQVPKDARHPRSELTPSTPDATADMSNGRFHGLVRAWRINLHKYDPPDLMNTLDDEEASQKQMIKAATETAGGMLTPLPMQRELVQAVENGLLVDIVPSATEESFASNMPESPEQDRLEMDTANSSDNDDLL